ncbi:MAG TPA: hypothetical protein VN606_07075 [Thermoleophilaceae bacterium]|jgi:hypothetical protein|nr:hypothetical protein [Thermoleophilaceae bacterium]
MLLTLGVFLGGLALVYVLGGGGGKEKASVQSEHTFRFPLNNTMREAQVLSTLHLGHLTPQDDEVELTLENSCLTTHLYAYLSNGWDHGPVDAAAVILGTPLKAAAGQHVSKLIRHDPRSALVIDTPLGRGVLVTQASRRSFNTLLVEWQSRGSCNPRDRRNAAVQLGRLFDTFRIV